MNKGLKKALEAAQTALEKATKENDAEAMKKSIAEADKLFKAFLKEAAKAARESEDENETESETESEDENEGESETGDAGDSHTVTTHKVVKKTGKAAMPEPTESETDDDGDDDDDAKESKRVAIKAMAKEAGLVLPDGKLARLCSGSLKEAKAEIADLKWMTESVAKQVIKSIKVPVANFAKVSDLTESDRESDADTSEDFLASCLR